MSPLDWKAIEPVIERLAAIDPEERNALLAGIPDCAVRERACELLEDSPDFGDWAARAAAGLLRPLPRLNLPCTLGHYRVERHLASGGMGEVYEAVDSRLHRTVAVKVLHAGAPRPLDLEARSLARLKHPHICRVFDIGIADGIEYFVMERIDGVPLSERLRRGPLPLREALAVGRALAGALAEAHRLGIVHRDVKPANILLTRNGPSLVDFGIADSAALGPGIPAGTPPYMAPEQARGVCDARSDIYSLGAVLREMTGVPETLPHALDAILDACLREDPEERWQSAADLARALEWLAGPASASPSPPWWRRAVAGYLAAAVITVAALAALILRAGRPSPTVLIPLRGPRDAPIRVPQQIALSPDGQRIAFNAPGEAGEHLIWIRKITSLNPEALPATVGATMPFWSPDGQSLGMLRNGRIETYDLSTAAVRTLAAIPPQPERLVWGPDGHILFSLRNIQQAGVIYRLSLQGGAPERITSLDAVAEEHSHAQPIPLPNGRHFLFLASSNRDLSAAAGPGSTYLATYNRRGRTLLLRGASAVGIAGDRVYYLRDNALWSQTLDVRAAKWADQPRLEIASASWAQVSPSGTLLWLPGEEPARPVWRDRQGRTLGELPVPPGEILGVDISRQGDVLVSRREDQSAAVSLWVVRGNHAERLGSAPGGYVFPHWSADARWIFFGTKDGAYRKRPAPGSPVEALLPEGVGALIVTSSTRDGRLLYGVSYSPSNARGYDIVRIEMPGRIRQDWSATPANETQPDLSPDEKWIAWLCEYPAPGRLCLSPAGDSGKVDFLSSIPASEPRWSPDGKSLYFISTLNTLYNVPLTFRSGRPTPGPPERLFQLPPSTAIGRTFAIAPDSRILVRGVPRNPPDPVLAWRPE